MPRWRVDGEVTPAATPPHAGRVRQPVDGRTLELAQECGHPAERRLRPASLVPSPGSGLVRHRRGATRPPAGQPGRREAAAAGRGRRVAQAARAVGNAVVRAGPRREDGQVAGDLGGLGRRHAARDRPPGRRRPPIVPERQCSPAWRVRVKGWTEHVAVASEQIIPATHGSGPPALDPQRGRRHPRRRLPPAKASSRRCAIGQPAPAQRIRTQPGLSAVGP